MRQYDIAIVGAGPGGSLTAAGLARRGYRVACIDRAQFPRDKACAEFCNPGVRAVLQRTGAWSAVAPWVWPTTEMAVYVHGRKVLPVRYADGAVEQPAFTIRRTHFDSLLVSFAKSSGVDVYESHKLTALDPETDHFDLAATPHAEAPIQFQSRFVVAADGLNSSTARRLGVRSTASWPRRLGLIAHFQDEAPDTGSEMHVGHGTYCGLASQPGRELSVGLVVDLEESQSRGITNSKLPDWALDRLPAVRERLAGRTQLGRIKGVGPMSRTVDRVSGDGFLLVGDAAGFRDPFTGEGLFRALRGAEIAVESIDAAFHSSRSGSKPLASAYASGRQSALAGKERLTLLIQLGLSRPALFSWACSTIQRRDSARTVLGRVLGDIEPSASLLRPAAWLSGNAKQGNV